MTTVQGFNQSGDVKDQESIRDLKATPVQKDATTPNIVTCRTQKCWEFLANNVASVCTGLNLRVGNLSNCPFHALMPETRHWRKKSTSFARKIVVVVSLNVPK